MKNNAESMKTVVETYIIEETAPLIYDGEQLEKWNSLIKDLGLTGQQAIRQPNKSPIPFMYLKASLVDVFQTLCPMQTLATDYNKTPIPLEIVELIALSVKEEYFDEIKIWYDDKSPDPACIGITKRWGPTNDCNFKTREEAQAVHGKDEIRSWNYETNHYLLGKWADVKQSFEELSQKAMTRYIKEQRATLERYIKDYERDLENLIQTAEERFNI